MVVKTAARSTQIVKDRGSGFRAGFEQEVRGGTVEMHFLAQVLAPAARAGLTVEQTEHVAGDLLQSPTAHQVVFSVFDHRFNDLASRASDIVAQALAQLGQDPRILIGGPTQHHPVDLVEGLQGSVDLDDAAIQHDGQIGETLGQAKNALVVQRWNVAVLFGTQARQPGFSGMDDDRIDTAVGHGRNEVAQIAFLIELIDTNSGLDGYRYFNRLAHCRQAITHQLGFFHQASPETTLLNPVRRTTDIEIDLAIAPLRTDTSCLCQLTRLTSTQLQGKRLLGRIEAQETIMIAMNNGAGRHHLRVQQGLLVDQTMENPAVAIGPVHHRGNAELMGVGSHRGDYTGPLLPSDLGRVNSKRAQAHWDDSMTRARPEPQRQTDIRFGRYRIDRDARELLIDGQAAEIEPKTLELLELLASEPSHTFSKDEIAASVWPERVISDSVISQAIRKIRKITGDSASSSTIIRTVHGVGYRFVAEIDRSPHATRPGYQRWHVGLFLGLALLIVAGISLQRNPALKDVRVDINAALIPFDNATGDDSLDWVSTGISGLLATGLNAQPDLEVIDGEQIVELRRNVSAEDDDSSMEIERIRDILGANLVISGQIQGQPDAWKLVVRINQPDGEIIEQTFSGPSLIELVTGQAHPMIRQTIDPTMLARPEAFSADPFVNETFARGLASELAGDNLAARDLFAVATRLDEDFLPGWISLARVQQFMGELDESSSTIETLRSRLDANPGSSPGYLVELGQIEGLIAYGRGDNELARNHFDQALVLAREHHLRLAEGGLLRYRGMVANREGRSEDAERDYSRALAVFERENYEPGRARAFNSLGTLAWRRDMINESEHWHGRALASFRRLGARDLENVTLSNLAVIASNRGRVEQAVELNRQVIDHHRRTGNRESEIVVLGNLAHGLTRLNRLGEAHDTANLMLELSSELGLVSQMAYARLLLGLVDLRRLAIDQAITQLDQARRDFEIVEDRAYLISTSAHLIRAHLLGGDIENARALHAQWQSILDAADHPGIQGQVLWVRSMLASADNDVELAMDQLEQARHLARKAGQIEAANTYTAELAELSLRAGRIDKAEPLLAQLDSFDERFLPALFVRARLDYELGRYSDAIARMEQARERAGDSWQEDMEFRLSAFRRALEQGQRVALGDEF